MSVPRASPNMLTANTEATEYVELPTSSENKRDHTTSKLIPTAPFNSTAATIGATAVEASETGSDAARRTNGAKERNRTNNKMNTIPLKTDAVTTVEVSPKFGIKKNPAQIVPSAAPPR